MRTPEIEESLIVAPDNGAHIALTFDDNRLASSLFGQYGQNLALIERRRGVVATLAMPIRPVASSTIATSVNVPPISTPIRHAIAKPSPCGTGSC